MNRSDYDLIVIGAGSGGLTAASFAAQLGARVAIVEKSRIGGDCTWSGCVPSKALLKAAKIAHEVRSAGHYGIIASPPVADMTGVREYVRAAIDAIYQLETPEEMNRRGIDVFLAPARFLDAQRIQAGDRTLGSHAFLIATGAHPVTPPICGLSDVPFITYEQIFDNDRLPARMVVIGAGPVGMEVAQAYRRLGAEVVMVAERLLPREEPEAQQVMSKVFEREGLSFVWGRATGARKEGDEIVVTTSNGEVRGDLLFVAAGRKPTVEGLELQRAGVHYTEKGITVDQHLRTNVKNIYAAGDVTGGFQFTHLAGWQAFQAVRNALLPGSSSGFTDLVPWVTFTDPEVAHVGLIEAQARKEFGAAIRVTHWEMAKVDRAVCENDTAGFIKVITRKDGAFLGATIVAGRAGESISEFVVALKNDLKVADLAGAIHAYPTYSTAVQQLAAGLAIEDLLASASGKLVRKLSGLFS
jgi:pyruvate/2-oxoglutarate dehydrogenase complex dihydrolipoamide dehydrogenase (E3) component